MRKHFQLKQHEPMSFEHNGISYQTSNLQPLAEKMRLATNISELVYQIPTGEYIYLTVVGDEDQTSGIGKGWYVAEPMTEEEAKFAIDAFAKFTAMYN